MPIPKLYHSYKEGNQSDHDRGKQEGEADKNSSKDTHQHMAFRIALIAGHAWQGAVVGRVDFAARRGRDNPDLSCACPSGMITDYLCDWTAYLQTGWTKQT